MTLADVDAAAKVAGCDARTLRGHLADRRHHRDWVAEVDGRIVGHARCVQFVWGLRPVPSPDAAPEGWYFMGAHVLPEYRRRGISQAFTEARLTWLRGVVSRVWYFTTPDNAAAIHAAGKNGFTEMTRQFVFPGNDPPSILFCKIF